MNSAFCQVLSYLASLAPLHSRHDCFEKVEFSSPASGRLTSAYAAPLPAVVRPDHLVFDTIHIMTPELSTLMAGLGGASIGFIASIITALISKHYEYKKVRETLILDAATKNWEGAKEAWLKHNGELMPLETFIAHQSRIIPIMLRKSISKKEIVEAMKESREIRQILEEVSKTK